MMKIVVTGGAGFIGSCLVDRLSAEGHQVLVLDDLSTGRIENLENAKVTFAEVDLASEGSALEPILEGAAVVYHLAANADVRNGINKPKQDIRANVVATQRLCEAAKNTGVEKIIFSSTGAVYGDANQHPTREDAPFPVQTSLYGMSKVAAEGILSTYASHDFFQVVIHRFVSVLGPRYIHGHVFDFVQQLYRNPKQLRVLGNGTQRKSYMSVHDCVTGLMTLGNEDAISIYNLGSQDFCTVRDSVRWVCTELGVDPEVMFGTEPRGWIGDNPFTWLDIDRALSAGWETTMSIESSIRQTVAWLRDNAHLLDRVDPRSRQA